MRLPSADEINVFDSLDERSAVENFLGKSLAQARRLFCDDFLTYSEDLMWMGPEAFRFYVPAAIDYLRSTESDGDSVAASSFCGLIEFRLCSCPDSIEPVKDLIRECIRAMLEDFDRYECNRGNLTFFVEENVAARYRKVLERLDAS
jgi:hypothetical protein